MHSVASTPLIPVILCGGTGTRLWPLSRASYPKQYWPLSGEGDATLMQQTQQRLEGLNGLEAPLLICNEDHRFIVAEQMRQIGVEPNAILLEPMGRNTAPAVTVAALQATAGVLHFCDRKWQTGLPVPDCVERGVLGHRHDDHSGLRGSCSPDGSWTLAGLRGDDAGFRHHCDPHRVAHGFRGPSSAEAAGNDVLRLRPARTP